MKRPAASWAGLAVLAGALSPPVEAAVGRSLAAHMPQHLALLLVGPGLLALDPPWARVASLLPRPRGTLDSDSYALPRPGMSRAVHLEIESVTFRERDYPYVSNS